LTNEVRQITSGPVNPTPEQEASRKRLRRDLKEIMGKSHSDARLPKGAIDRLGETAAKLYDFPTPQTLEVIRADLRRICGRPDAWLTPM
jgi:hypothetical protein